MTHNSLVLYVLLSTFKELRYYKQLPEGFYPKTWSNLFEFRHYNPLAGFPVSDKRNGNGDLCPITRPGHNQSQRGASSTANLTFQILPPNPPESHTPLSSGGDPAAPHSRPAGPFGPGTARGWAGPS